jgi:transposase-like protein
MKSYEPANHAADQLSAPAPVTIPVACPACQSRAISTTARNPDTNAYWRCARCGEVWNPDRYRSGRSRSR